MPSENETSKKAEEIKPMVKNRKKKKDRSDVRVVINLKVAPDVKEKLERRALRFTKGNLSELLRRGAFAYNPKKAVGDFY